MTCLIFWKGSVSHSVSSPIELKNAHLVTLPTCNSPEPIVGRTVRSVVPGPKLKGKVRKNKVLSDPGLHWPAGRWTEFPLELASDRQRLISCWQRVVPEIEIVIPDLVKEAGFKAPYYLEPTLKFRLQNVWSDICGRACRTRQSGVPSCMRQTHNFASAPTGPTVLRGLYA